MVRALFLGLVFGFWSWVLGEAKVQSPKTKDLLDSSQTAITTDRLAHRPCHAFSFRERS